MRTFTLVALLLLSGTAPALRAQSLPPAGGGGTPGPQSVCVTEAQRQAIWAELHANRSLLYRQGKLSRPGTGSRSVPPLDWPLRQAPGDFGVAAHGISNFFDHNPAVNALQDYTCGTRTYDLQNGYNHQGTDFFSWPFGWYKMDYDLVEVVAVAPGVIIAKQDNNFDRSCTLSGANWNAVYVQHFDGSVAWYGHLKRHALTPKAVGDTVQTGEFIGVMGSSGSSTGPHLHLELYNSADELVDPYHGDCQAEPSRWLDQPAYYDSGINALMTHSAAPVFPNCPQQEIINAKNAFCSGQTVYFAVYLRDQRQGQISSYVVRQPDGTVWQQWTNSLTGVSHYPASYWYWGFTLPSPAPAGSWTYEATYEGETYTHTFEVNTLTAPAWPVAAAAYCPGDSVALHLPGTDGLNLVWRQDGQVLTGAQGPRLWAKAAGNYTVELSSGCAQAASDPIPVYALTATGVPVEPAGVQARCPETSLTLSVPLLDGVSYQWRDALGPIPGATTPSLTTSTAGTYLVRLTQAGCSANLLPVTVFDVAAPSPTVSAGGDGSLVSTPAVSYQWYVNGDSLPGATGATYLPTQSGQYTVAVVDSNGCRGASSPFNWNATRLETGPLAALSLFPNPAPGRFSVRSPHTPIEAVTLYDLTGRSLPYRHTAQGDRWQIETPYRGLALLRVDTPQGQAWRKVWLQD